MHPGTYRIPDTTFLDLDHPPEADWNMEVVSNV